VVVDDEPGIRALTVDALSYCVNRDVVSFPDGISAWHYLDGVNGADLVISDVDMPAMDGLELLGKFKKNWEDKIFILMSGREENEAKAESAGADAFLKKPFSINDLFKIVQHFVVD